MVDLNNTYYIQRIEISPKVNGQLSPMIVKVGFNANRENDVCRYGIQSHISGSPPVRTIICDNSKYGRYVSLHTNGLSITTAEVRVYAALMSESEQFVGTISDVFVYDTFINSEGIAKLASKTTAYENMPNNIPLASYGNRHQGMQSSGKTNLAVLFKSTSSSSVSNNF